MTVESLDQLLSGTHLDSRDLVEMRKSLNMEDDREEMERIDKIISELEEYAEDSAEDGIFLIRESYWTEYAQELAEDVGAINDDAGWPSRHIDWKRAAEELAMDYTTITIDDVDWYYR